MTQIKNVLNAKNMFKIYKKGRFYKIMQSTNYFLSLRLFLNPYWVHIQIKDK